MKLYMADIHLHRARLFRDKLAFAQARRLIEQCAYWRRKEELEDAEEAAKEWPEPQPANISPPMPAEPQQPPTLSPPHEIVSGQSRAEAPDSGKSRLVILVHGICTRAEWQGRIRHLLEADGRTKVEPLGYGYFDVLRFLWPFITRRRPVKEVEFKIRDALNIHRGKRGEVIFVGHSFGTYILSTIMSEEPDIRADRVLLCGSIVSRTYRWDKLPNRPKAVLNEVGSRDIWPILANSVTWGYGSTGTFGFQTPGVRDRYHNIAHSDYFKPGFAEEYWVPWIRKEVRKSTPYEAEVRPPTPFFKNLFEIVPLKWVLLTLLALAIFVTIRPYWLGKQTAVGETSPRALDPVAEPRPAALAPMLATAPVPLGDKFVGRTKELGELDQAWQSLWNGTNPARRIVAVVAWGGFGKTALVRQWLYLKDKRNWPRGTAPEGIFWWTFGKTADADGFLNDAIAYFSGKAPEPGALQSDYQKLDALRRAVGNRRFLFVLDGLEAVQRDARGEDFGKTTAPLLASILKELASGKLGTGLSLITSRLPLTDLGDLKDGSVVEIPLEQRPLELVDARLLLTLEGVTNAKDAERDAIIEWCDRHPLALKTLAGILLNHNGGKASGWERFVKEDKLVQPPAGREAERQLWRTLHWYDTNLTPEELRVMSVLALFREPVAATWVEQLFVNNGELAQGRLREPGELRSALDRLVQFRLLERAPGAEVRYDLHALLAEHFRTLVSEVDRRAIHDKLYHYYAETVQPEFQPKTLDGLRPLYEAVYHGCKAGLYQGALEDVYIARILRGTGHTGLGYSTDNFGAHGADLGAVACFFKESWKRLAPDLSEEYQVWLLNQAAHHLGALGRLTESLEAMRTATAWAARKKHWKNAAIGASMLSELELTLGKLAAAMRDAEQSVQFADRSGDSAQRVINRTTLANARHQSGARADALALFREAESIHVQQQPEYPLLYSLPGFRYCDLLLGDAERMAWATTTLASNLATTDRVKLEPHLDALREAGQRAQDAQRAYPMISPSLLTLALDQLTLGRAALYRAILEDSSFEPDREPLMAAVDGLRASGVQIWIPAGLLSRAWLRFVEGDPEGAKADLDEAWQIAERGSMKLHMADILLHRARLFGDRAALDAAARLIEETGYHRRDGELADAREALNHPQG